MPARPRKGLIALFAALIAALLVLRWPHADDTRPEPDGVANGGCGAGCVAATTDAPERRPFASRDPPKATPRAPRPGPASMPPPLRWLSAEDEVKLDAMAVAREAGIPGTTTPTPTEHNRRFEREERDPAWATAREDTIRAVLEERRGELADARVGEPVCKASICLLRAIIETTGNDRLNGWQRVGEFIFIEREGPMIFHGASTSYERVDGETVALTYLLRREPPAD